MKYPTIVLILVLASAVFAFPQPVGYVNDFANILPNGAALNQDLAAYEQNTTIEIAVVTIESLPADQDIYTYSVELFQQWGIGQKGEDNGILVLMVKNGTVGNRLKIELGYGIQGYITGAESGRILDAALPYYNQGDYQTTADTIVAGLQSQLVNYVPGNTVQSSPTDMIIGIILTNLLFFIALAMMALAVIMRNRCPYCRGPITCTGDYCTCKKCGRKFKKHKRYAPFLVAGGFGGGGGGFGGFGGGASGGGGAGR